MKYLLPLLLLTGCAKTYTNKECAQYVLERAGLQQNRPQLEERLRLLCAYMDNDPKAAIEELNKLLLTQ